MKSARTTRLVYGGFICLIGFAIEVAVMALIAGDWFAPRASGESPYLPLSALAAATACLFIALNISNRLALTVPVPGTPRLRLRLLLGVLGVALLVVAGLGFHGAADPQRRLREYELYALILPEALPQAAQAKDAAKPRAEPNAAVPEDAAPATTAEPAATASPGAFVWLAEKDLPDLPNGALPLFLGGFIALAFGCWYPRMSVEAGGGGDSLTRAEKVLAPLLSLGLVALGATQQASAAKTEANLELARQGLPPAIRVDGNPAFTVQPIPYPTLNDETASILRARLDAQALQLIDEQRRRAEEITRVSAEASQMQAARDLAEQALTARLNAIAVELADVGARPREDLSGVKTDLNGLNSQLGQLKTALGDLAASDARVKTALAEAAETARAQNKRACDELEARVRHLGDPRAAKLRAEADEIERQRQGVKGALRGFTDWLRSTGAVPSPAALRAAADREDAQRSTLAARQLVLDCPDTTATQHADSRAVLH